MSKLADQIDTILPQTQCGLCGYKGCRPYAEALAARESTINLCPPGGTETLEQLAELLDEDAAPYRAEMQAKQKAPQLAVIRENECIGCTKCIQACPTDAIIGAAKQMHSILDINCSGCGLCISPCPVDCIDLVNITALSAQKKQSRREHFRKLSQQHQQRLNMQAEKKRTQTSEEINSLKLSIEERQAEIKAAILRRKTKQHGS